MEQGPRLCNACSSQNQPPRLCPTPLLKGVHVAGCRISLGYHSKRESKATATGMDMELNSYCSLTGDEEQNLSPAKMNQHTITRQSPDGNKGLPISKRVSLLNWVNNHWVLEIASCIGSLVALFGIIGFLLKYDGTTIPNWPYGITINSVLSWIVLVFNAFMLGTIATCFGQMAWLNFSMASGKPFSDINLYHWASRGAIGCFVFIWESRMRHWPSLGALATILAVGVSPFIQQMATVQNTLVPVNLPASVGRAQTYLESEGMSGGGLFAQPTDGMLAAIYGFVLASPGSSKAGNRSTAAQPSVPVTCDSGYCDFSPFRSLAVCSDCSDISNALTSHCKSGSCTQEKTMCNYSLPNGMQVNISDYVQLPGAFFQANVSYSPEEKSHGGLWPQNQSMIFNLTEIKIPSVTNTTELRNAFATQCALYWCVNTYTAQVRNHALFETLEDSWHDPSPPLTMTSAPGGYRIDLQPPTKDNLTQSNFTIDGETSQDLQYWLLDKMQTGNIPSSGCHNGKPIMGDSLAPQTEFSRPIFRSSLNDVFQNLAATMTTRVRQLDLTAQREKPTSEFGPIEGVGAANGTSFIWETQIKVQWAWIILPSLLFILTSLFLGVTMLETKRRGLKVWKLSPTAMICSGLDETTQQQARAAGDLVKMEELVADIQVYLQEDKTDSTDDSWRLGVTRHLAQS